MSALEWAGYIAAAVAILVVFALAFCDAVGEYADAELEAADRG